MTPTHFGHYRLEELIGRGGAGEVYRAVDLTKDRDVAVKLLAAGPAGDGEYRARFRREAELAARLSSPHVIPIHDYGEADGRLYLDMPLIRGRDGAAVLDQDGPMPAERAVHLVAQAAHALDAAHAAHLVHRDVKPSNLLITDVPADFVYLVDFGIVRAALQPDDLTVTGRAVGTLHYMAPESFEGRGDRRVDVYALACVLFEFLTGTKPFDADLVAALMYAHLSRRPPRLSSLRDDLPPELDAVVERGLAKDPEERYPTAGDLARAAQAAVAARSRPAGPAGTGTTGATEGSAASSGGPPVPAVAPAAHGAVTTESRVVNTSRNRGRRALLLAAVSAAVLAVVLLLSSGLLSGPFPRAVVPTASVRSTLPVSDNAAQVAVTADGALACLAGSGLLVVDTADLGVVRNVQTGISASALQVSSGDDTAYLGSTDPDGRLVVVDLGDGSVVARIPTGPVGALALSPDGALLYAVHWSTPAVLVIDAVSHDLLRTVPISEPANDIVLSPDGATAYLAGATSVSALDLRGGQQHTTISTGGSTDRLALTPDGSRLVAVDRQARTVSLIDTGGAGLVAEVPTPARPTDLALSPDGALAYVTHDDAAMASILDLRSAAIVAQPSFGQSPGELALGPDGRQAWVVNERDGVATVIDLGR